MELLTICLRDGSFNSRVLTIVEELARKLRQRTHRFDKVDQAPLFSEDSELTPSSAVTSLRTRVKHSDAVLIATPEYRGSMPGVLKNLLDWAARPVGESMFISLPVAVISASPSEHGGARARQSTEFALERKGAAVVSTGRGLPHAHRRENKDTGFLEDSAVGQLRSIITRLSANHESDVSAQVAELTDEAA